LQTGANGTGLIEDGREVNAHVFFSARAQGAKMDRADAFPAEHEPIGRFQDYGTAEGFASNAETAQHVHLPLLLQKIHTA
jgi:hypothetical protein